MKVVTPEEIAAVLRFKQEMEMAISQYYYNTKERSPDLKFLDDMRAACKTDEERKLVAEVADRALVKRLTDAGNRISQACFGDPDETDKE